MKLNLNVLVCLIIAVGISSCTMVKSPQSANFQRVKYNSHLKYAQKTKTDKLEAKESKLEKVAAPSTVSEKNKAMDKVAVRAQAPFNKGKLEARMPRKAQKMTLPSTSNSNGEIVIEDFKQKPIKANNSFNETTNSVNALEGLPDGELGNLLYIILVVLLVLIVLALLVDIAGGLIGLLVAVLLILLILRLLGYV